MKSILMSIQPKWCEKIINGEKTIEVRKTAPKEVPFKDYIYCTGVKNLNLTEYVKLHSETGGAIDYWHGKVIGEFICDKVEMYWNDKDFFNEKENMYYITCGELEETCLTYEELCNYGKGKTLYGLHITDLKLYDKPRELSDFRKPDTSCRFYIKDLERCDSGYNCERCVYNDLTITRPPQSWQYVGEIEE